MAQALLRPEFADIYPGIPPNEWQPTAVMAALVLDLRRSPQPGTRPARPLVLNEQHFAFRGVVSAGSREERQRHRREGRRDSEREDGENA